MEQSINQAKTQLISEYLQRIDNLLEEFRNELDGSENVFDLLSEVVNVFGEEIPQIKSGVSFGNGMEIRDLSTAKASLKLYLANNGVEYNDQNKEENTGLKRFWASFILWFENELVNMELLKPQYLHWDNWNGGTWYLDLDYNYEFKLRRGIEYPDSLKNNTGVFEDIKMFLEIAYKHWIINEGRSRYDFTVEVNERFRIFKSPYKMQNGIILKQGYKTSFPIDKIINFRMFERKIRFSEDMINSNDMMEKKSALDFLVDSLQYLISIQEGNRQKQYATLTSTVNSNQNSKVYSVVKQEINDLMKFSNEYFDIRHNDYLNDAKEKREPLNDSQFIEYMYNRAYALLYLLRLKHNSD